MGLGGDILALIGVLPIKRPNFDKKVSDGDSFDCNNLYRKKKKLEELNGKYRFINDIHNGPFFGQIIYASVLDDKYFLKEASKTGKTLSLFVHDLQHIW